MAGTPSGFAKQYRHAFKEPLGSAWTSATTGQLVTRNCIYCGCGPNDPVHTDTPNGQLDTVTSTEA